MMVHCLAPIASGNSTAHDHSRLDPTDDHLQAPGRCRQRYRMLSASTYRLEQVRHDARHRARPLDTRRGNSCLRISTRQLPIPCGTGCGQISIARLAHRGFVQQGFCNASQRSAFGLRLSARRRRNLISVRRLQSGQSQCGRGRGGWAVARDVRQRSYAESL